MKICMAPVRSLYMANSRNNAVVVWGLILSVLFSATVRAVEGDQRAIRMAGVFAEELNRNGALEIRDEQQLCASDRKPLSVSQELTAIMVRAVRYSVRLEVRAECRRMAAETEYQDCRFYFYSPNKAEQWSVGLAFLGKPETGQIRFDTLHCFSTP